MVDEPQAIVQMREGWSMVRVISFEESTPQAVTFEPPLPKQLYYLPFGVRPALDQTTGRFDGALLSAFIALALGFIIGGLCI